MGSLLNAIREHTCQVIVYECRFSYYSEVANGASLVCPIRNDRPQPYKTRASSLYGALAVHCKWNFAKARISVWELSHRDTIRSRVSTDESHHPRSQINRI